MFKLLLIAIAPSIALLLFIYQKDRYDREPLGLLFKLFIYGAISTVPIYLIEKFMYNIGFREPAFQAFIVAGLTEELFKFLIVFFIAFNSKSYNEKLDGIIYSVFVSLGFATIENILYILNRHISYVYIGISRAIFALPAHMLFAITMGYYLSIAKFSRRFLSCIYYLGKALVIPIILHGIYDYILIERVYGFLIIFIAFVLYLWKVNLAKLNRYVADSRKRMK
jgi:RsiW-degrading membrane proteinase PrsW (M82 family)